jgi:predicted dehydrogenase/threonine dehydrogenase-like Zn-dependent dehydrogenase
VKQLVVRDGGVVVVDVPAPEAGPRSLLIRVESSCISVGTETASLRSSAEPLYRRALKDPQKVVRLFRQLREQGIQRTASFVSGKLNAGAPTGYSAAGVVIGVGSEVEGFRIGDRVACAGSSANHAEVIDVPVNLAVAVPDGVTSRFASTVAIGAIALQGVRRAAPTLGENVVVVGLGILGQITAQILRANGCRVIGVDLAPDRIEVAMKNGMDHGIDPAVDDYVERVFKLTGFGADAVIVTAASRSDAVISDAMRACRRKGRVVLVGDVGLNLNRADFYQKELDFLISTSYGPGRYDPVYEQLGQDYPLPYVRWTETRNMEEYLRLLTDGRVKLDSLHAKSYPIDRAAAAYGALNGADRAPMLVLLSYPERPEAVGRTVSLQGRPPLTGAVRVGLAGVGQFAQNVHLPNLAQLRVSFAIRAIMSRTGAGAQAAAAHYRAAYVTTDYDRLLDDAEIDLVLIATRHNLHGDMALRALRAGKHVFVEKPLTIDDDELRAIRDFYAETAGRPLLMTGFNRRFSPALQRARQILAGRTTPLIVNYRMNAGYVPPDSWVHGDEGGGRNVGEACHIYDVFNFLTDARVSRIQAAAVVPRGSQWRRNDNFVAQISYDDGSVCSLTYTAMGDRAHPKEQMEVFADGRVLVLDDYTKLNVIGSRVEGWSAKSQNKGLLEELHALSTALKTGGEWPIPLWQQIQATSTSFEVERQIRDDQ